ncbi:peptidoglycan-binding protein [Hoeflea sp.]|uniref:peptidoglycan-binding protein n=1 Tax=Hoeflea sp. TaxID=1940281 RepID=UPI003B526F8A
MTFETWLQSRLAAYGHDVGPIGGAFGTRSRNALISFQRQNGLKITGVADEETVAALRRKPSGGRSPVPTAPAERMPPWMAEMYRRKGLHEGRNNSTLSKWLRIGRYLGNPAKLPWCGDAVETAIVKTLPNEPVPDNPFWAQAWSKFGVAANAGDIGAIGVIRWSARAGHVGIVAAYDAKRQRVLLLGGNQSDAITLSWFPLSKFIAFRWPSTFPKKGYPSLDEKGNSGSLAGTR